MDAEQRIALELERQRQTSQRSVYTAAIAQPVCRPHQQTVEPLVPGRAEQALKRCPVGETGVTLAERVLPETAGDTDHGGLDSLLCSLPAGPIRLGRARRRAGRGQARVPFAKSRAG